MVWVRVRYIPGLRLPFGGRSSFAERPLCDISSHKRRAVWLWLTLHRRLGLFDMSCQPVTVDPGMLVKGNQRDDFAP
jgi:hypothetical protein